MYMSVLAHVSPVVQESQKWALDPWELELQTVVTHHWVLEPEPQF